MDERPNTEEERDPAVGESGMREGLDREYASMGTGEAGAGVGGGGASSSDVEWEAAADGAEDADDTSDDTSEGTSDDTSEGTSDDTSDDESPAGGAMTDEQDIVDPST